MFMIMQLIVYLNKYMNNSANVDYVGISQTLEFAPGITMKNVKVVILDDLGNPVMEGLETFDLVLRMPIQAILGEPQVTHITINDTESDCKLLRCWIFFENFYLFLSSCFLSAIHGICWSWIWS